MKSKNRVFLAAIGVLALLFAGLVYSWPVVSKSIAASYPDWTAAQLSLTFTIMMMAFCLGGLAAGMLAKRVKPAFNVIFGAVLFLAGFLIAASAGAPLQLYLGFGVLCGLGSGFVYNAVMSTVCAWFPDKQGRVSGILLMGYGISGFLFGKIFAAVAPADGGDAWRTVFRIFAVLFFVILVLCSFFIVRPGTDFQPPASAAKRAVREPASEMNAGQMLRTRSFWMYFVWVVLTGSAGMALVSQAGGIAGQVGPTISGGTIATVVGLISILNGIGRIIFGTVFDRTGFRIAMILDMAAYLAGCAIMILAIASGNFALIIPGFILGGLGYGGVPSINSAVVSDFFGRENYPVNFSLINTNVLIASLASTVAGKLYDISHSYITVVIMMIVLVVAGFVVFLGIRRPEEKG